ncbi:MAG: hypothetical protein M1826_004052 [Phylliscum demangeonii]|nr:MAG: hypothetical protein M1826_004052 [Phylliscum demangeonii]
MAAAATSSTSAGPFTLPAPPFYPHAYRASPLHAPPPSPFPPPSSSPPPRPRLAAPLRSAPFVPFAAGFAAESPSPSASASDRDGWRPASGAEPLAPHYHHYAPAVAVADAAYAPYHGQNVLEPAHHRPRPAALPPFERRAHAADRRHEPPPPPPPPPYPSPRYPDLAGPARPYAPAPLPAPAPAPAPTSLPDPEDIAAAAAWPSADASAAPTYDRFEIHVRQQPLAARACGFGERDRRVIDPPPIAQLTLRGHGPSAGGDDGGGGGGDPAELRYPFYVLHCTLWDEAGRVDETAIPGPDTRVIRRLMGTLVTSSFVGLDEHDRAGCFFGFPDLSCRTHGRYRLRFVLMRVDMNNLRAGGHMPIITSTMSDVFTVFTAKDFPGMRPSTALTKALKRQGYAISVKKGNEKAHSRARDDDSPPDSADDDPAAAAAATATPATATATAADPPAKEKKRRKGKG